MLLVRIVFLNTLPMPPRLLLHSLRMLPRLGLGKTMLPSLSTLTSLLPRNFPFRWKTCCDLSSSSNFTIVVITVLIDNSPNVCSVSVAVSNAICCIARRPISNRKKNILLRHLGWFPFCNRKALTCSWRLAWCLERIPLCFLYCLVSTV